MKAKYLFLTLAAALFSFTSCGDDPKPQPEPKDGVITLEVHPNVPLPLLFQGSLTGEGEMWIDLNGDNKKQEDEKCESGNWREMRATASSVKIHGKVTQVMFESAPLRSIDATGNPFLYMLLLEGDNGPLENIDLSKNTRLAAFHIHQGRHLTRLKLPAQAKDFSQLLLYDCFHMSKEQLLEIAKIVPDRTGQKIAGGWNFTAYQPSQEVTALFEKKNWNRVR